MSSQQGPAGIRGTPDSPGHPSSRGLSPSGWAVGERAAGDFAEVSLRSAARRERGDLGSIGSPKNRSLQLLRLYREL